MNMLAKDIACQNMPVACISVMAKDSVESKVAKSESSSEDTDDTRMDARSNTLREMNGRKRF